MRNTYQRLIAKVVDSKDNKTLIGYKFWTKIGTRGLFQVVLKEQFNWLNIDCTNVRVIGKVSVIDGNMSEMLVINDKNQYIKGQALSIAYKKDNQYLVLNGYTEKEEWLTQADLEEHTKRGQKYFNVTLTAEGVKAKKQPLLDLSKEVLLKEKELKKDLLIEKFVCRGFKKGVTKKVLEIPQGTIYIAPYAFASNNDIEEVRIPMSVRYIEAGAFQKCKNLKRVIIETGCELIGAFAFSDCENLKEVVLPQGLYSLGNYSFSNTGLEEINIPNTVRDIESNCFSSCSQLKRVHLPKRLKKLNSEVFSWCTSLKTIEVPKGVKEIDDTTFFCCYYLKVIKLPQHLKEYKHKPIFD